MSDTARSVASSTTGQDTARYKAGVQAADALVRTVAADLGEEIVAAFEAHDAKAYDAAVEHFRNVYEVVFPGANAAAAAEAYADALRYHDVIEDGLDAVTPHGDVPPGLVRMDRHHEDAANHAAGDLPYADHPGWRYVHARFREMADHLDLPPAYAMHQAEFFRYHTEVRCNDDLEGEQEERLEERFRTHAAAAQTIRFSELLPDDVADGIAAAYLDAVDSHDAHDPVEQDANRKRMTDIYRQVLAEGY